MNKDLEKRMYFLVPYNISPIQQAIQAGHAALEYAKKYKDYKEFIDFVDNWKTWIILNGGTTNSQRELDNGISKGTLNQMLNKISDRNDIKYSYFEEPDLNNALTAVCVIVDERVFNRTDYPDFKEWAYKYGISDYDYETKTRKYDAFLADFKRIFGEDIYFLKELLNNKKLA